MASASSEDQVLIAFSASPSGRLAFGRAGLLRFASRPCRLAGLPTLHRLFRGREIHRCPPSQRIPDAAGARSDEECPSRARRRGHPGGARSLRVSEFNSPPVHHFFPPPRRQIDARPVGVSRFHRALVVSRNGRRLGCASLRYPYQVRRFGRVLHSCHRRITLCAMKSLTVRLPEALVAEIEAESRQRRRSKSDVVRERLSRVAGPRSRPASPAIADLVGSVDGLPVDLSGQKKAYLKSTGYGRKRAR